MSDNGRTTYKYYIGTGLFLILIFTVIEPEGTEGANFFSRMAVWSVHIGLLLPMLIALHMLLQMTSRFNQLNSWVKLAMSGVLGSLIFVPFGLFIDYLFGLEVDSPIKAPIGIFATLIDEFVGVLFPVTLTWIAINTPRVLKLDFSQIEAPTEDKNKKFTPKKTQPQPTAFVKLIPKEIGQDVVYIKSELHYVRVGTIKGEKLVLYNLKDAIVELEQIWEGIQTHRSYWVSGRHIEKLENENGKNYVLTRDGHKIPISRRRLQAVKDFMKL